ncbi:MAG: hypothetical protein LBK29_02800 [Oscillospiraceae bacterium]|nr:hypothetical protein [Oscillospiraceae bacterium]
MPFIISEMDLGLGEESILERPLENRSTAWEEVKPVFRFVGIPADSIKTALRYKILKNYMSGKHKSTG